MGNNVTLSDLDGQIAYQIDELKKKLRSASELAKELGYSASFRAYNRSISKLDEMEADMVL